MERVVIFYLSGRRGKEKISSVLLPLLQNNVSPESFVLSFHFVRIFFFDTR